MLKIKTLKGGPILLAGGMGLTVLLGGCGGNNADTTDAAPATTPPVSSVKPAVPGTGAGAKGGDGTTPAAAQPAQAGLGGAPPAPGQPAAPGAPAKPGTKVAAASIPNHRKDPFYIDWHQTPPPPYVFNDPSIQPLRIASADVETPPVGDVAVREVANRRVSGIMSGDGVFAILETAGGQDSEIVKPGSQTKDGYRVVSITADSVKLQRKDGNIVRTQVVPLSDQSLGGFSGGGGGMMGGGRGLPGSGGMPGMGMPGSGGGRGAGRAGKGGGGAGLD